ncbi:MAG: hypothetical protein WDN26_07760 [Chitinophagaceae bacterium]
MWSEENDMDNKLRKAAEANKSRFQEKDWQQMEALLDKHLPQEKKRRRFIFILLLTALIGVPAVFMLEKWSTKSTDSTTAQQEQKTVPGSSLNKEQTTQESVPENKTTVELSPDKKTLPGNSVNSINDITAPVATITPGLTSQHKNTINTIKKTIVPAKENISFIPTTKKEEQETKDISSVKINPDRTNENFLQENKKEVTIVTTTDPLTTAENNATVLKEENVNKADSVASSTESEKPEQTKATKTKGSKFSINLSAGTDISSVGTKAGNAEIAYGVGIGYSFSDKWTIRTGFFAGRKKYAAKPSDYHPADNNFWYYYPNMQKIDANCYVYEIPVNVMYSFGKSKNHNWFLSGGVSSYLMKKEKYDYTYKNNAGMVRQSRYTFRNENSHLFSVINLSGGYQYNFNKRFSLLAEPYLKMPVSGIGFGKVKLNSAGVLFTASFKPFLRTTEVKR